MGKISRADVSKVAHVERLEITRKIVPLRGVIGRKKGIERASKLAMKYETDVAYSDLVIEGSRSWLPQSIAETSCETLPIGIVVSMGHEEWEEETGRRCAADSASVTWQQDKLQKCF